MSALTWTPSDAVAPCAPLVGSDASFEWLVLRSPIPALVFCWASWCGPSRLVAAAMDALARDYVGRLRVVKVNTDDSPGWSSRLGILGIPAFLFFKGGREVERVVGNVCLETLDSAVERVLGTER